MNTKSKKQHTIKNTKATGSIRKPKKRLVGTLNPEQLIQRASLTEVKKSTVIRRFEEMNLHKQLKLNVSGLGYISPTEIQDQTFDKLVNGSNLIGIASTGTGKTGAFLLPLMEKLLRNNEGRFQSLIVVPTRELALQVYDEFKKISTGLNMKAACFIGGTNVEKDVRSLNNYFDLVIGTPGRLLDLKNRGKLKINRFEVLVLDEFDKMLDMGFVRDIRELINGMNQRKQTMLFSATKDPKQQTIINELVVNPLIVEICSGESSSKNVDQDIIRVQEGEDKFKLLTDLLEKAISNKVILFTETKHLANRLSQKLNAIGVKADQIHGNKSQNYRVNALEKFKNGSIRVLVATDVAARGIDVENVSLVVNYQLPRDFDTYIHRVGRTGRAGKTGTAYTFVD